MYYFSLLSFKISSHTWIAIVKYSVLHFGFTLHFLKYVFHSRIVSVDWFAKFFSNLLYFGLLFLIFLVLVNIYVFLHSNWFLMYFLFVLTKDNYFVSFDLLIVIDLLYLWNFLFVLLLLVMSLKQLISSLLLLLCFVALFCVVYELSIFCEIITLYKFSISDL